MSDQDIAIGYYGNLLAIQWRTLPRATATMQILAKQAIADLFPAELQYAFDLATAVGPQLDILGKYIGVSRDQNGGAGVDFFQYDGYTSGASGQGYNDYTAGTPNTFIYDDYTGGDLPTTAFSDTQYRFVLQLQIALNNFDGTLAYIQNFLAEFFPDGEVTVVDNLNMSLTYTIASGVTLPISATVLENFLPVPMGCGISVVTGSSFATLVDSSGNTLTDSSGNPFISVPA